MLEEKAYTRQEIRELLETNAENQGLKRMLERRDYEFFVVGSGRNAIFTITKLPSKFKMFCISELGFAPQTDFTKLRNFFYYYLNSEDFRNFPDTIQSERMSENGMPLSRQTIGHYRERLFTNHYFWPDFTEFNYYLTHSERGKKIAIETDRKTYAEAWALYWRTKEETKNSEEARMRMFYEFGGYPNKSPIIRENAITADRVVLLNELVLETFIL